MKIEISIAKLIGLAFLCMIGGLLWGVSLGSLKQDDPKFHKYDVNQDGTVSQLDVLHIVNYLNRTSGE